MSRTVLQTCKWLLGGYRAVGSVSSHLSANQECRFVSFVSLLRVKQLLISRPIADTAG
jgi:hypothetical protein